MDHLNIQSQNETPNAKSIILKAFDNVNILKLTGLTVLDKCIGTSLLSPSVENEWSCWEWCLSAMLDAECYKTISCVSPLNVVVTYTALKYNSDRLNNDPWHV